jgi:hypothetical protein
MSSRPLNAHVSLVIFAMVLVPSACGSQTPDPVRFSKVMVVSDDGATIQLVADICRGQPYTTVVKESADLVSIQLLATRPEGHTALSCSDLVEVQLPTSLSSRRVHDATAGVDVPVQGTLQERPTPNDRNE